MNQPAKRRAVAPRGTAAQRRDGRYPKGVGSKPRVDKAQRRREYIDSASKVFLELGLNAATMQDIADAAGITKVHIYRVFGSKEGLLDAILDEVLQEIHAAYAEPGYVYGGKMMAMAERARRRPAPFQLVFRYCRAGVEQQHWEVAITDVVAKYNRAAWYEPHPEAPAGAEARADAASRQIGVLIDTLLTWIEDRDGLDWAARGRWWSRFVRTLHLARRDAYRLGPPTRQFRSPNDA